MGIQKGELRSMMRDEIRMRSHQAARPPRPLRITAVNAPDNLPGQPAQVTWLGHSTMLLYIHGKTLLCDPVFNKMASPFSFIGPKRFAAKNPVTVEDLPPVDAVCISHDHYDHLDHQTIKKLKRAARHFFVPLGVGAHLERWGVAPARITELDWWEETTFEGLKLACTPSRHFSGRTLTDRFKTLWASWVISDGKTNVYFSGDTGYGAHFKKIGKKYGPFDLTMLECGQYDTRWPNVHMTPEQTATAHLDLHGKRMLPMHWGAFRLAFHTWTEPVERVLVAAAANGSHVVTPRLGETMDIIAKAYPTAQWWSTYTAKPKG
jgi:L-ascorbate metabolism protein UlaG (beta-lactamase superfamily)